MSNVKLKHILPIKHIAVCFTFAEKKKIQLYNYNKFLNYYKMYKQFYSPGPKFENQWVKTILRAEFGTWPHYLWVLFSDQFDFLMENVSAHSPYLIWAEHSDLLGE